MTMTKIFAIAGMLMAAPYASLSAQDYSSGQGGVDGFFKDRNNGFSDRNKGNGLFQKEMFGNENGGGARVVGRGCEGNGGTC